MRRRSTGPQADIPAPAFVGRRVIDDVPLAELVPFIDWTFFFSAWELKGKVPKIFEHPDYGHAARELYDHAQALLERITTERPTERERRLRLLAGGHRRRRHRPLHRRVAHARGGALPDAAAAGS